MSEPTTQQLASADAAADATLRVRLAQLARLLRRHRPPAACNQLGLSILDPIELGIDENGRTVTVTLAYRNILIGGEPGAGKSVLLSNIIGHAAFCPDVRLILLDGKLVELGMWRHVADTFVGPRPADAIEELRRLQTEMDAAYERLFADGRRKLLRADGGFTLCVIDEIAYYSATAGDKKTQETFSVLLRDLVARGRAVGIIVVAATQRPSADIIPTSLRDIFGYRCAFRCTNDASSDIILGQGWAKQNYTAVAIAPEDRGVGWLLAEGGRPRRFKAAYLTDQHVDALAGHTTALRASWRAGQQDDGRDGS